MKTFSVHLSLSVLCVLLSLTPPRSMELTSFFLCNSVPICTHLSLPLITGYHKYLNLSLVLY